jgi:hypothetical protein
VTVTVTHTHAAAQITAQPSLTQRTCQGSNRGLRHPSQGHLPTRNSDRCTSALSFGVISYAPSCPRNTHAVAAPMLAVLATVRWNGCRFDRDATANDHCEGQRSHLHTHHPLYREQESEHTSFSKAPRSASATMSRSRSNTYKYVCLGSMQYQRVSHGTIVPDCRWRVIPPNPYPSQPGTGTRGISLRRHTYEPPNPGPHCTDRMTALCRGRLTVVVSGLLLTVGFEHA